MSKTIREGKMGGYKTGSPWSYMYPNMWTWMVKDAGVRSVIDVGCAEGHCLNFFKFLGCRVRGVEGCKYAVDHSLVREDVVLHDYAKGPYVPEEEYDLGWSSDFVEHVEEEYVQNYMATFKKCSRYVCLTFAPKGYGGYHHVNTNDLPYWVDLFSAIGFRVSQEMSEKAKGVNISGGFVTPEIEAAFPEIVQYRQFKDKKDAYIFTGRPGKRTKGVIFERV